MMPRCSTMLSSTGTDAVRNFKTAEEAIGLFVHENASPPRTQLVKGSVAGSRKANVLGQLGNGGSILSPRDDGWGRRDSEE